MARVSRKPKQSYLALATWGAGFAILLYVAGYFLGKPYYRTPAGATNPGSAAWFAIYKPLVFLGIEERGVKFSELGKPRWVTATLADIDYGPTTMDFVMSYQFSLPDGPYLGPAVKNWDSKAKPVVKKKYSVQVVSTLEKLDVAHPLFDMFHDPSKRKHPWVIEHQVIKVGELAE